MLKSFIASNRPDDTTAIGVEKSTFNVDVRCQMSVKEFLASLSSDI